MSDGNRRTLFVVGAANYEEPELNSSLEHSRAVAESIPQSVRAVIDALGAVTYTSKRQADECVDLPADEISQLLSQACCDGDIVVLYWTGHGLLLDNGRYVLATADFKKENLPRSGIKPEALPELMVRRSGGNADAYQPPTLIILDCCFSQNAGVEILKSALTFEEHRNLWVMATAGNTQYAQSGEFARVFSSLMRNPDVGHLLPVVPFDAILAGCSAALRDQSVYLFAPPTGVQAFPPFFPNRKYVERGRGLTLAEIDQHWVAKATGAPAGSIVSGSYVSVRTGRLRAFEEIAEWLATRSRGLLAIVTGSPGTGKSTILALPVLLARARSHQALLDSWGPDRPTWVAMAPDFTNIRIIDVHARGLNADQVAAQIAAELRIKAHTTGALLDDLHNHPRLISAIVLVDAVDEAADPLQLRDELLLPLTRHYGMRLVIGARPNLVEGIGADLRIDLNAPEYHDPEAVVEYVSHLLMATYEPDLTPVPPYRSESGIADAETEAIARTIAEFATAGDGVESFLIAQVIARAVRSRPDRLNVDVPRWQSQLPADFHAAFDEELRGLGGERQHTAVILLEALAFAKGPGLPWENIWPAVGQAIQRMHPRAERGAPITEDDIRWLLSRDGALNRAGAYILEDLGPGNRSVFRPFHDRLTDHLRAWLLDRMSGRVLRSESDKWVRIEAEITDALMSTVRLSARGSADWSLAHPYLRTYLGEHAAAAGLDKLFSVVRDWGFLAVADPSTLTPLLSPISTLLAPIARIYRRARPLLGENLHENAAYLLEAGVATGNVLGEASDGIRPIYATLTAFTLRDDALLTLTGVRRLRALAAVNANDGRAVLVTCNEDGVVQTTDPRTGSPAGQGLRIPQEVHPIVGAAIGQSGDGTVLLAAADGQRAIRVWDIRAGAFVAKLDGHSQNIRDLEFLAIGSSDILLVYVDGTAVWMWDPNSEFRLAPPLDLGVSKITALATAAVPGRPALIAAGREDGSVQLWRCTHTELSRFIARRSTSRDAESIAPPAFQPYRSFVTNGSAVVSMAFDARDGSSLWLAVGTADGGVYTWDVASGATIGALCLDFDKPALIALCSSRDGTAILAVNGRDNKIELLDPVTGDRLSEPQGGHGDIIEHILMKGFEDDDPMLATASSDGTVRIWDVGEAHADVKNVVNAPGPAIAVGVKTSDSSVPQFVYVCKGDTEVHIWDAGANKTVDSFRPAAATKILNMGFGGPDETATVYVGVRGGIVRAYAPDGVLRRSSRAFVEENPTAYAFGTFGERTFVVAGRDPRRISVWDFETEKCVVGPIVVARPREQGARRVTAVTFGGSSLDDAMIAVAHSVGSHTAGVVRRGSAIDIRAASGATGFRLCESDGRINAVAMFEPHDDGEWYLAEGGEGCEVTIWRLAAKRRVGTIRRRSAVRSLAAIGRYLVIGDDEGVAAIELEAVLLGSAGRLSLVVGGGDGSA